MSVSQPPVADIGELVRDRRRALGLTQEELAERAGVSPRSISELERGGQHFPRRDTIHLLSRALGFERAQLDKLDELVTEHRRQSRATTDLEAVAERRPTSSGHNIPRPLTRFIGREEELAQLAGALSEHPLLTLVGPGGVGKTRLAEELVRAHHGGFADGCWFVDLAGLFDASLVPIAIGRSIGLRQVRAEDSIELLVDYIGNKQILLVLDNCDHLIEATAEAVAELLGRCARLQVVVTSREPLSIAGERRWQVLPFAVPATLTTASLEQLSSNPAVQLFLDRAAAVENIRLTPESASKIARICMSVDGIPLALELAAASTRMFAIDELADRLDADAGLLTARNRVAPMRHRTLRATIDWSHDLLSEPERALLRRVSVFAGGWELEAVEDICSGSGIECVDVIGLLAALVDKSIVVVDARGTVARYRLLEPVRQYALERLEAAGEVAAYEERHAAFFLALARSGPPSPSGPEEIGSIELFEREHTNLRAALRWAMDHQRTEAALTAAASLFRFWERRGHFQEGCRWLERGLAADDIESVPTQVRCAASNALAFLYWRSGAADAAEPIAQQALELSRVVASPRDISEALLNVGMSAYLRHEYAHAQVSLEESVEYARAFGRLPLVSVILAFLGRVLLVANGRATDRALVAVRESIQLAGASESRYASGHALATWGDLQWAQRDLSAAVEAWQGALIVSSDLADPRGVAGCVERLAMALVGRGCDEPAAWLLGAADAHHAALGLRVRRDDQSDNSHFAQFADQQRLREVFPSAWLAGSSASLLEAAAQAIEYTQGFEAA